MPNHLSPPRQSVQILRLPQVCKVTGLGRSMIYHLESVRRFPCRVRIGARAVGWVESEVQLWLADRVERYRAESTVGNWISGTTLPSYADELSGRSTVEAARQP